MVKTTEKFLPLSQSDLKRRGWKELDIILVTGDAYVDHPSYAVSILGRVLEDAGFRVGIIAQPNWLKTDDFKKLGRPRLFFGVTAGNLDSMVANYTANKKPRRGKDDYSPGGRAGLRPDRATIIYTNRIREAFGCVPIVLGGLEASMRRLAHYDYWSGKVRRSILLDSKADILVYGMGERQIIEIARQLKEGKDAKDIEGIRGTVVVRNSISNLEDYIEIPSFEEVSIDKDKFNRSYKLIYKVADPLRGKALVQKHGNRFVIQFPPPLPLSPAEMDRIYELDYAYDWHPSYEKYGSVPGFETVRHSVVSNRGCCGGCNFCTLYLHQGRLIQSRSEESIVREVKRMTARKDFKGTVTDIGGPTANLYKAECAMWRDNGACADKNCLVPSKCVNLKLGYDAALRLFDKLSKIEKVKHVFIGSGVRYDLLVDAYSDDYLKALCARHISGQLKVAPEHVSDNVLKIMNKPPFRIYEKFLRRYFDINKKLGKNQYLVQYFISSHPGSTLESMLRLALYIKKLGYFPEQVQDFIPMPMTRATAIYYTGKDPITGEKIYCARTAKEKSMQRAFMHFKDRRNKKLVMEALKILDREELAKELLYGK